jgi:hypothetical protein
MHEITYEKLRHFLDMVLLKLQCTEKKMSKWARDSMMEVHKRHLHTLNANLHQRQQRLVKFQVKPDRRGRKRKASVATGSG